MERNSDKTSEVSTQVKDTSNKGKSIMTQEILDHTRGTSAGENSNLTVMTPSEPHGMQNTGSVSFEKLLNLEFSIDVNNLPSADTNEIAR
jgi:hypothetical protein